MSSAFRSAAERAVRSESKMTGGSPIDLSIRFIHFVVSRPDNEYVAKGIFTVENHLEFPFCLTRAFILPISMLP